MLDNTNLDEQDDLARNYQYVKIKIFQDEKFQIHLSIHQIV